jgi:hypothetical protein
MYFKDFSSLLRNKNSLGAFLLGLIIPVSCFFLLSNQGIADSGIIRPNANGTSVSGTPTGCTTTNLQYDCWDEVVTQPSVPSTGSDFLTLINTNSTNVQMSSLVDVASVSSITVWFYHAEGGTNAQQVVSLYAANETTQYGTSQNVTNRTAARWDSVTFSGLSLTQAQLDDLRIRVACTKIGGGTSNTCTSYALYADVTYTKQIEVDVASNGTQQNIDVGATNAHVGGSFVISSLVGSRNITSITVAETGTVNASTNLSNIKLFYEMDVSSPYNCASETYAGTETQYGATDSDGFSGANGTSVFTGSVGITTTSAMCVYVVMDVGSSAVSGETIEIQITNPSTSVIASGTNVDVQPATPVTITGTSVLVAPKLDQLHYHWRDDDGLESNASSLTNNTDDTPYDSLGKLNPVRLRLAVSNEGNETSDSTQYRLEYATKVTSCSAISDVDWTDVGVSDGGDWDMYDSSNLTNGDNTTDIAESLGGVANSPGHTFLTPNSGVLDTSSQSSGIILTSTQFVELEYSLLATNNATVGNTYCFRLTDAGTRLDQYSAYPEATILADVNVSAEGTQATTVTIPTTDVELGAGFVLKDNISGTTTITSVKITASGTVDFQNDLDNIELWYDFDTTGGDNYSCTDQSFDGNEIQFGSTDTNGFSVTGESTFSDSVDINDDRSLCLYVVYDVTSGVENDETLDIKIVFASTDVTISAGTVSPNALVDLSGMTTFVYDRIIQSHYHWRDDDGSEAGATSATGDEDVERNNLRANIPQRLRIGMTNSGSASTPAYQFRLEYALKTAVCSAISNSNWVDVGAVDGAFDMFDSPNVTDGDDTTNIATSTGGVSDETDTFFTNNNAVKDTSSQVASITLPGKNFVDLEYSIEATLTSIEGATYCFRVTDAGTAIDQYDSYPEVTIKPKTDFFTQRGVVTATTVSTSLVAGVDYVAPASSSTAFIRITNTLNSGAGSGTTGNADDVTVYVANPWNIENGITFERPVGATGNTRIAWEIIEYVGAPGGRNEIIVRQQSTATYDSASTTVTTASVPNVADDSDIAIFVTGQRNPDTNTNYPLSHSTASWGSAGNTATFSRGASGNTSGVSYAVVEFVGDNWQVQRDEHTYSVVGTTETSAISPVTSLTKAFIHTQKRMGAGLTTHGDYGHLVWLSGIGQLSYVLDSTASTPSSHTSVTWVIENLQTAGTVMAVTRSNGTQSGGASPTTLNVDIGKSIADIQDSSIFINNTGNEPGGGGGQNSFPEPMISSRLISETQYEIWIADVSDSRSWRAEVVEWPTASRDITQNYYRFYVDNDALTPTDPWPAGATDIGENTEITELDSPIAGGETMRIRMTLQISSAGMVEGLDSFKLQYGERNTVCSAISENEWVDVGSIGSTTALWRGYDGTESDGTPLSTDPPTVGDLKITSVADVAATYEEQNPSAVTPYEVIPGEDVEFDWVVENNSAKQKTSYCFRMVESTDVLLIGYNNYPTMRTAGYTPILNIWQWFDDETNLTPSSALANENVAPTDIANNNIIKLRTSIVEKTGGEGTDIKFKLQFSQFSDFSQSVFDVVSTSSCQEDSLWCYADGSGVDNEVIDASTLSDTDSCSGGAGLGCGTHNEGTSTTTATFDHPAYATTEYEFTLEQAGARASAVYYFRLFDITNATTVPASTTNPSLVVEGPQLTFTIEGVEAGEVTEGIISDVSTTPTSIPFGSVPLDTEFEAVYRINLETSATQGYQILMYATQPLLNVYGEEIAFITNTNQSPQGWSTGCLAAENGCFGYHTGDDVLSGGSTRFAADDSYAAFSTSTPEEIMHSSTPAEDVVDIVFKIQIGEEQPAGIYETEVIYIAIPVF